MVLPQNLYTEWYWSGTLMHLQEYVTYAVPRIHNMKQELLQTELMKSQENSSPLQSRT